MPVGPGSESYPWPMRSDVIGEGDELAGDPRHRDYWRRNLRLIAVLMLIWALVTFGIGYFARELDFSMLGWPFSFWVGAQGALFVYVALVAYYAWAMNRLDGSSEVGEAESPVAAPVRGTHASEPQR